MAAFSARGKWKEKGDAYYRQAGSSPTVNVSTGRAPAANVPVYASRKESLPNWFIPAAGLFVLSGGLMVLYSKLFPSHSPSEAADAYGGSWSEQIGEGAADAAYAAAGVPVDFFTGVLNSGKDLGMSWRRDLCHEYGISPNGNLFSAVLAWNNRGQTPEPGVDCDGAVSSGGVPAADLNAIIGTTVDGEVIRNSDFSGSVDTWPSSFIPRDTNGNFYGDTGYVDPTGKSDYYNTHIDPLDELAANLAAEPLTIGQEQDAYIKAFGFLPTGVAYVGDNPDYQPFVPEYETDWGSNGGYGNNVSRQTNSNPATESSYASFISDWANGGNTPSGGAGMPDYS